MSNIEESSALVNSDEIRWVSEPDDRIEDFNLLTLEHDQLLEYACELRSDLRIVRRMWHDTIGALARTVDQRDRAIHLLRQHHRQERYAARTKTAA